MNRSIPAIKSSIYALVKQNKTNSLIYSLAVPLLVGIYSNFYSALTAVSPLLFWGPVVVFVLFALLTAYITYDVKLAPEVYIELEEAEERSQRLQSTVEFLSELQEQCLGWNSLVREHFTIETADAKTFQEIAGEVCRVLVESRGTLFGIETNELWNFTLYIFNHDDNILYPIWRDKHPRHPSPGNTRVWAPGQGHVGIAFAQGEPKICPDATVPGVREVFSISNEKDYDRSAYVSFASEPIGPVGSDARPYGVLVATSNRSGRFNVATSLALRHAASALASLVHLRYDRDSLSRACEHARLGAAR